MEPGVPRRLTNRGAALFGDDEGTTLLSVLSALGSNYAFTQLADARVSGPVVAQAPSSVPTAFRSSCRQH